MRFGTLVLALSLAACGGSDVAEDGLAHLIMAWDGNHEPASLDGHVEPYQPAWLIDSLIADPLIVLGPDGAHHPALAASWSSNDTADVWTFELRQGVTFQDGTPFDAEAVKYNIERILAPETRSGEMAAQIGPIGEVEITGEHSVTLHYDAPWVTALDAFRRVPIWSPTAAEKWGLEQFDKHLVGAGPFRLAEWVPNDHVTLEKWDGYGGWSSISKKPGPVALDRVTIRFITEEAVLGNLVKTGDAHIAMNLPAAYTSDYQDVDGFSLLTGYQAGTGLSMVINTRNAPLSHLALRKALLYGTNQKAANDLLYDGQYSVSDGVLNQVHPCYWEGASRYEYDPGKAKSLLERVGYADEDGDGIREARGVDGVPDGTPLELTWTMIHSEEIAEVVQAQWLELGIRLRVEKVPGPVQLEKVNARNFDIMYERQRSPDPLLLDMMFNSANDVVGGWAWTGFVDDELDAIVAQLRTVPDLEDRCTLSRRAQELVMENALLIPTLSEPIFYAVSDEVRGFQFMSEGQFFFLHNTYLVD